jgi:hypothetical protein
MNEIDDEYKTKEEELDQNIEEELSTSKKKEKTLEQYINTLHKQRAQREKAYTTYLTKQKKAIWNKKKKKEKKEPFKHLTITHFSFTFTTWEKIKHYIDVTYFNTKREIITKTWKITPNFALYHYYKATKEAKRLWHISVETYQETKKKTIEWTTNTAIKIWEKTAATAKKIWTGIKKAFSRLRGTKKEEEGEEKTDEKGEEQKEGEETKKEENT